MSTNETMSYLPARERRLLGQIVRVVHRLLNAHRFEPCTLTDLYGQKFVGRRCSCGRVDDDAWERIGFAGFTVASTHSTKLP